MGFDSYVYKILNKTSACIQVINKWVEFKREAYRYCFRDSDVKARVKRINGGYKGSNTEYKRTVLQYWSKYGIKPKKAWYALYCDGMNSYNPFFIPDPIWFKYILPYFNCMPMVHAYADKGIYNRLFTGVKKPETVVKRIAGYYYNGDGEQPITREEAERLCEEEDHLIVKPSGGAKGAGILFYDRDDEKSMGIHAIFDEMLGGFVAQRLVKQHPDLARLNSCTLNTLRIISFRFKGEIHILSAQLRIGGKGARVDNVSAGGCACAVKADGWLQGQSVTRQSTWTDETADGIKLNTIHVPSYDRIVEMIKRLHWQVPYFNIVGWDFAVNEDGTPVFIEFNTKPGQNQIGCKQPSFGDLTDEVLDDVFKHKSLKNAFKR